MRAFLIVGLLTHFAIIGSLHAEELPLDVHQCVELALRQNGRVAEAQAKVEEYEARLAQIESVYYPKLMGFGFVAPTFGVKGSAMTHDVERKFGWRDWGPYARTQMLLVQPFYTFGRAEAGEEAARERAEVERARLRETENLIALEVKRFYYGRLLARSILPSLQNADKILRDAQSRAQKLFSEGSGDVTQVDLAKLDYGGTEIVRNQTMANDLGKLAASALKHSMGLPDDSSLVFADNELANVPDVDSTIASLPALFQEAASNRPEWAQIEHGRRAALKWEEAERLANYPAVFVAGQLTASWTPTREDSPNPYNYDPFNEIVGGLALGVQFNVDPMLTRAKGDAAHATYNQINGLKRFAATGIPLQVRKAYEELSRYKTLVQTANTAVVATRKWMTFAGAAYSAGTGEARDLLEGLVAYLRAKQTYFETLHNYYIARSELDFAVGRH